MKRLKRRLSASSIFIFAHITSSIIERRYEYVWKGDEDDSENDFCNDYFRVCRLAWKKLIRSLEKYEEGLGSSSFYFNLD